MLVAPGLLTLERVKRINSPKGPSLLIFGLFGYTFVVASEYLVVIDIILLVFTFQIVYLILFAEVQDVESVK